MNIEYYELDKEKRTFLDNLEMKQLDVIVDVASHWFYKPKEYDFNPHLLRVVSLGEDEFSCEIFKKAYDTINKIVAREKESYLCKLLVQSWEDRMFYSMSSLVYEHYTPVYAMKEMYEKIFGDNKLTEYEMNCLIAISYHYVEQAIDAGIERI